MPEAWLRGPIPGIDPYLMPAAHALVQAGEELRSAAAELSVDEIWARPGGAASIGFHLRHVAGSLDRLLTYARGEPLTEPQLHTLRQEGEPGEPPESVESLLASAESAIEGALQQLRSTPREILLEARQVGRQRLPSTVIGLLFHAAEHTQRHAGQVITTARVVRGMAATADR